MMDQSLRRIAKKCGGGGEDSGGGQGLGVPAGNDQSRVRNKRGGEKGGGGREMVGQSDGRKIQYRELTGDSLGVCALHCFFCMRTTRKRESEREILGK